MVHVEREVELREEDLMKVDKLMRGVWCQCWARLTVLMRKKTMQV